MSTIAWVFSSRRSAIAARSDSETGAALWAAAEFFAQVDDADFGERAIGDAGGEFEQVIFSVARVVIGLERRSGGAEQHDGAF